MGRFYGIPRGEVQRELTAFLGVDKQLYMAEGHVALPDRDSERLAEARAQRSGAHSEVQGMSPASRKAFYRSFFGHVSALETRPSWFLTLTHGRNAPSWEQSKALLNVWQQYIRDNELLVFGHWVAELQRARADIEARRHGAVHYHLALSYDGTAAAGERVVRDLGERWRTVTGDEGSTKRWRGRYAFDLRAVGNRGVDRLRIGQYLRKVGDVAAFGRELAKAKQKGADVSGQVAELRAYGRTWGVVNRKLLGDFWKEDGLDVDPRDFVSRAVAVRRVLHEVIAPDLVPKGVGLAEVVPLKTWGVGDEAVYLATGDVVHLLDMFRIKRGSPAALAAAAIHEQCRGRVVGWQYVRMMDSKVVDLVAAGGRGK